MFRHGSISIAITFVTDIVSVSEQLGHSDTAVTLRMYAHANQESVRRVGQIVRNSLKAQDAWKSRLRRGGLAIFWGSSILFVWQERLQKMTKPRSPCSFKVFCGAATRIRTGEARCAALRYWKWRAPRERSPVRKLTATIYRWGIPKGDASSAWSCYPDSNRGPHPYQLLRSLF